MPTDPDLFQALVRKILADIDAVGRHITGVAPAPGDEDADTFAYTTGLTRTLGVELAIATLGFELASPILSRVASAITTVPTEGERIDLGDGQPVLFHRAGDTSRFGVTRFIYGGDPVHGVWQVLWPDPDGRFPTEAGYDHARFPQPLY